jgi:transposase
MWVVAGRRQCWKIAPSRRQAMVKSFLPEYEGLVTSDRYAAYNVFNRERRQVCWAHLARDFERMAHRLTAGGEGSPGKCFGAADWRGVCVR